MNKVILDMKYKVLFILLTSVLLPPLSAQAGSGITVASWNVNHLGAVAGVSIRPGTPVRTERDYSILASYRKQLNADIIALQEMGSPQAAARIFPEDEYTIIFSSRYNEPVGAGRTKGDIYTALAIRKPIKVIKREDLKTLQSEVERDGPKRWTRRGVGALLEVDGKKFWALAVHLKSGCHKQSLNKPKDTSCKILSSQRIPLEKWTDRRFNEGIPFMILGDFNRVFDKHEPDDHLWNYMDDGDPAGLELKRLPYKKRTGCPGNEGRHPIDFLVFDKRAWKFVKKTSFREIRYSPAHAALGERLSDHCPISVRLTW